jgi:NAD(P)-dependent dehydrogenase (short-subunit alcohol dehydrogenase family)
MKSWQLEATRSQHPVTLSKRPEWSIFSTGWKASALLRWAFTMRATRFGGPPLETKPADFEAMWRVGCLGGFIFGREVARRMLPRGHGTIIYSGPLRGRAAFAAFAAAKAGLRMVSQSFAREFGPRGIHVAHVIIDGSIEGDKIFSKVPDIGQQKGPDGLLHPDVIADSYWYLHTQHRSAWSQELDVRPYAETF